MTQRLDYDEWIPTFGDHRPLWPVYGEYKYVPVQRWLHSLEVLRKRKRKFKKINFVFFLLSFKHGSIVMLYHPCSHPMEVIDFFF